MSVEVVDRVAAIEQLNDQELLEALFVAEPLPAGAKAVGSVLSLRGTKVEPFVLVELVDDQGWVTTQLHLRPEGGYLHIQATLPGHGRVVAEGKVAWSRSRAWWVRDTILSDPDAILIPDSEGGWVPVQDKWSEVLLSRMREDYEVGSGLSVGMGTIVAIAAVVRLVGALDAWERGDRGTLHWSEAGLYLGVWFLLSWVVPVIIQARTGAERGTVGTVISVLLFPVMIVVMILASKM